MGVGIPLCLEGRGCGAQLADLLLGLGGSEDAVERLDLVLVAGGSTRQLGALDGRLASGSLGSRFRRASAGTIHRRLRLRPEIRLSGFALGPSLCAGLALGLGLGIVEFLVSGAALRLLLFLLLFVVIGP